MWPLERGHCESRRIPKNPAVIARPSNGGRGNPVRTPWAPLRDRFVVTVPRLRDGTPRDDARVGERRPGSGEILLPAVRPGVTMCSATLPHVEPSSAAARRVFEQGMASMRRELIVDALILLVLALVGYGFLLTPGEAPYSPHSDFVAQGLATKTVLWNSLRAGDGIPFWRHDELAGNVALTNPQSLYTYPLHLLFYLMEPVKAVGPTFWLHFLVAGFVGYIVAMSLGLGRAARLLTAAAMMFSFKLIMVTY